MKKAIQILHVNTPEVRTNWEGTPFNIITCETVVRNADGTVKVGVLTLPQSIPTVQVGLYVADFEVAVDYGRDVVGELVSLHPVASMEAAVAMESGSSAELEVLSVNAAKTGKSRNGKPYSIIDCECIVFGEKTQIGVLTLPKDLTTIVPGRYKASFEVGVYWKKRRIVGLLTGLSPVGKHVHKPAQVQPTAPAAAPAPTPVKA